MNTEQTVYVVNSNMRLIHAPNGKAVWDASEAPMVGTDDAFGYKIFAHYPVRSYKAVWASRFGRDPEWHVFPRV